MLAHGFGLDRVNKFGQIDVLLRELPAVRPTTADRLSRIAYQTDYGIYDHANPHAHPLASVLMHTKENVYEGGPELTYIRRWYAHSFHSTFGLSISEYFALPFHQAEFLYELCISSNEHLTPEERKAAAELRGLQGMD